MSFFISHLSSPELIDLGPLTNAIATAAAFRKRTCPPRAAGAQVLYLNGAQ
jgi:hypothetical protein